MEKLFQAESWSMLRRPSAPQWISKWQNIFGTFQIECEKFWIFGNIWSFIMFQIFSEKFRNFSFFSWFSKFSWFSWFFLDFSWFSWFFHEKSKIFKKSKNFLKLNCVLITFLWSRSAGNEASRINIGRIVFLPKSLHLLKNVHIWRLFVLHLGGQTHVSYGPDRWVTQIPGVNSHVWMVWIQDMALVPASASACVG